MRPVFPAMTNVMIEVIRLSLLDSTKYSATLFLDCTLPISRTSFFNTRDIFDDGKGCVYAYFNDQETLYVGTTGSHVKSNMKASASPHEKAAWWSSWTHMRLLPLKSANDRLILEHLLIFGLAPMASREPEATSVEIFLKEIVGD